MGKRSRKRGGTGGPSAGDGFGLAGGELSAPTNEYTDGEGNRLELRGALTLKARQEYADILHGGLNQDDAWQRAIELLFERLTVAWTIHEVRTDKQKELLMRYRVAGAEERRFVRDSLRAHAAEYFPDIEAP
jgi:hypothetical protein